jgi:fatty-acyl-CoA synthase
MADFRRRGGVTARTLAGLLRTRASSSLGDRVALRCRSGTAWRDRTWAQYWDGARRAATGLRKHGIGSGVHVLVLVPDVECAVLTLFGAWTLGAVPIQIGLPFRLNDVGDVGAFLGQLSETARRLDARALVLSRSLAPWAVPDVTLPVLIAEELLDHAPDGNDPNPDAFAEATALVQLTSGTTGRSRGIVISHECLVRHMECMSRALPSHEGSVAVSWLPLHHDMGLVGGLLFPFYNGFAANMLSPSDFRARPFVWLEALSAFRATISAAPPSAYAMLLRLARRAIDAKLDLSAWECAMVGAEPISAELLRRLADALSPVGFRADALFPVYGLAEATVAVTFPKLLAPTRFDRVDRATLEHDGRAVPKNSGPVTIDLVGVGRPIPGTDVRIAGPDGAPLADRCVGEILVRSTTLMRGYYDDAEATAHALRDGWLRTGDLGYLADGELFITGRLKDVIIRGGLNLLPTAIEEVAASVDGSRAGSVAAVGVRDTEAETEIVWLLVETKLEDGPSRIDLRKRVDLALKARGIVVDRIELLAPGVLPKTTSGKLRRGEVAAAVAAGTLRFE